MHDTNTILLKNIVRAEILRNTDYIAKSISISTHVMNSGHTLTHTHTHAGASKDIL